MKIIQNFLLIFLFLFITNNLFAGLGNTTWGAGGIKTDIEVNEIEVIEEENKKQSDTIESDDKFKSEYDPYDNKLRCRNYFFENNEAYGYTYYPTDNSIIYFYRRFSECQG